MNAPAARTPPATSTHKTNRSACLTALAAAALAVLTATGCDRNDTQPMLGTLERDRLELIAEAREEIVALHVTEGQRVEAGQLLVELDSTALDARLAQARAQASEARARLEELEHGPRAEAIAAARAQLAEDEARVVVETKEYERQLELVGRNLVSQSSVDRQRAARDAAQAALRASAARLEELTTGTRAEQIAQARETLASREAAVRALEIDLARLDVVAPRAGLVDALPYELGERPPAGAPVVVLLGDGAPYARIYVPEPLRARTTPGTDVRVRVDGVAQELAGRVRWVSSDAAFTPYYALTQKDRSRLAFLAEVMLTDATAERLPAGIPVEVRLASADARANDVVE